MTICPSKDLGSWAAIAVIADVRHVEVCPGLGSKPYRLELGGHEVEVAHAGDPGVDTARRFHPDIVLCDIGLPGGMDGYAVARALRQDPAFGSIYLVAVTGYGQEEDCRRSREAGFDLHLTKPVDPVYLEELLANRTPQ